MLIQPTLNPRNLNPRNRRNEHTGVFNVTGARKARGNIAEGNITYPCLSGSRPCGAVRFRRTPPTGEMNMLYLYIVDGENISHNQFEINGWRDKKRILSEHEWVKITYPDHIWSWKPLSDAEILRRIRDEAR